MSKQQRTAGADFRVITLAGKAYTIRPLTVGVYAAMEAYVVSRRPDPLVIASDAVKRLPQAHHDAVWKAAMASAINSRTVSASEMAEFENSVDGLSWRVWQCLKADHPEIDSVKSARDLILKAGESGEFDYLVKSIEIGSGEADIKKPSGQVEVEEIAAPAGQ